MSDVVQFIHLRIDVLLINQANPKDLAIVGNRKHSFSKPQTAAFQIYTILLDHITPQYPLLDLLITPHQNQVILGPKGKQILLILLLTKHILTIVLNPNHSVRVIVGLC